MAVEWAKVWTERVLSASRRGGGHVDGVIATLAEAQCGLVTRSQLFEVGLSADQIQWRVAQGSLHRVHRGVYAVGHRLLGRYGALMAAALACGPSAGVGHRSAGFLRWGLQDNRSVVDVVVPKGQARKRKGNRLHSHSLHPEDCDLVDGIPCTSSARTLVDMASGATFEQLRKACRECARREELDFASLQSTMDRIERPRGITKLKRVLDEWDGEVLRAVNAFEERIYDICADAGLPRPSVNKPMAIGGRLVKPDLWWGGKLVVEADGGLDHTKPRSRADDLERERLFRAAGYTVRRFNWSQVTYEPEYVVAQIRTLLDALQQSR